MFRTTVASWLCSNVVLPHRQLRSNISSGRCGANYAQVLPSIQCRAEVLHQPDTLFARDAVRRVAELVPNGRFHDLPPIPAGATLGEALIPVLDHVEELATGTVRPVDADRFLTTQRSVGCVHPTAAN
ncbi:hypothetical protein [Rhodococcus sp. O3]|uniref:hypothetical protein n=1 Tax=Rhodococcus sp. O3 TaxID=3404919 RepID=UPI003B67EB2F